uniref:Uncharacterized protein n=1 Tax=Cucumis melo TaxID=3656 RepID=A0A9I9EK49_CUCME
MLDELRLCLSERAAQRSLAVSSFNIRQFQERVELERLSTTTLILDLGMLTFRVANDSLISSSVVGAIFNKVCKSSAGRSGFPGSETESFLRSPLLVSAAVYPNKDSIISSLNLPIV